MAPETPGPTFDTVGALRKLRYGIQAVCRPTTATSRANVDDDDDDDDDDALDATIGRRVYVTYQVARKSGVAKETLLTFVGRLKSACSGLKLAPETPSNIDTGGARSQLQNSLLKSCVIVILPLLPLYILKPDP